MHPQIDARLVVAKVRAVLSWPARQRPPASPLRLPRVRGAKSNKIGLVPSGKERGKGGNHVAFAAHRHRFATNLCSARKEREARDEGKFNEPEKLKSERHGRLTGGRPSSNTPCVITHGHGEETRRGARGKCENPKVRTSAARRRGEHAAHAQARGAADPLFIPQGPTDFCAALAFFALKFGARNVDQLGSY